jgi:hypothetical protein
MPLPLPNLDDYTYDELVEMARSLIPSECPDWTDHNPSDTGIVLIELFAWLTELLLYQTNQIPDQSQVVFLQLLRGDADWHPGEQSLNAATRETILGLRQRYRAVTVPDYATLVRQDWPRSEQAQRLTGMNPAIARVNVLKNLHLNRVGDRAEPAPGHISVVALPQAAETDPDQHPELVPALQAAIWSFLDDRRLLGIKHHVVGPEYVTVRITASVFLEPGYRSDTVKAVIVKQLQRFFHPLKGGDDGRGWPFGRAVYLSEIYQQIDQVTGVDYVTDVTVVGQTPDNTSAFTSLRDYRWQIDQLVKFDAESSHITVENRD